MAITTVAELRDHVRTAIGFDAVDSIVVVGIGHAPTARLDLGGSIRQTREALAPMVPYLTQGAVVLIVGNDITGLEVATSEILPGVEIHGVFPVDNPENPLTREDVETLAASAVSTVEEAEEAAVEAYGAGRGALAWMYHDRAIELNGGLTTPTMTALSEMLTAAVAPTRFAEGG